jgi:hypothetical protein
MRTWRRQPRHRRRHELQRREQNIGEHEVERRALAQPPCPHARGPHDRNCRAHPVVPCIVARAAHGDGIEVARKGWPPQGLRRRDREHAAAGADIENAPRPARLRDPIEGQQAAAGGAVVAGAEGERGFDLDADAIWRYARAVVGAVDEETPGGDRCKPVEAGLDPIPRRDRLEHQRVGRLGSGRKRN